MNQSMIVSSANYVVNPESSFLFLSSFPFIHALAVAKEIPVSNR